MKKAKKEVEPPIENNGVKGDVSGSAIVRKATYTIEYIVREKGTTLNRKADGFNPFELLGLLDLTRGEIIAQMQGKIKPDIIKREVVGE